MNNKTLTQQNKVVVNKVDEVAAWWKLSKKGSKYLSLEIKVDGKKYYANILPTYEYTSLVAEIRALDETIKALTDAKVTGEALVKVQQLRTDKITKLNKIPAYKTVSDKKQSK